MSDPKPSQSARRRKRSRALAANAGARRWRCGLTHTHLAHTWNDGRLFCPGCDDPSPASPTYQETRNER